MNRLYKEFLVDGGQFQPPIPSTMHVGKSSKAFQPWLERGGHEDHPLLQFNSLHASV